MENGRSDRLILRLDLRLVAAVGALAIFALVSAGALFRRVRILNLGEELTVPSAFSGGMLFIAALAAFLLAGRVRPAGVSRLSLIALACVFAFMALDEMIFIHERLEVITGVDWQILYAPIVLVAGVAWVGVLLRLWSHPRAAALWLAGAAAWIVAQGLERAQWDGAVLLHPWITVPEEGLEMTGSALFALALLVALQSVLAGEAHARTAKTGGERRAASGEAVPPGPSPVPQAPAVPAQDTERRPAVRAHL